jgi:hypothetical protein
MAPDILRKMRAHRVTSRPSSFGETSNCAGPPARRTTRPGCRQGHRCDIGGAERANRRHPRGLAGLDYLGPVSGRPCYFDRQGCDRRMLAQVSRSDGKSRIRYRGEVSVAGWRRRSLQIPFGWLVPRHVRPTAPCDHLRTDAPPARISCGASSLGQRSREVFEVSPSSMWLVVFKMMHRSGGRQGYGQLLTALAGLTDRERSPQNFSSALWAPLTLRLSPGAASFQHQPTREETT